MGIVDTLILLGSVAAAITAITVLLVKTVKQIKKVFNFFRKLDSSVNTLIEHDKSQYLAILRLTIVSDSMPISERLLAGKEYIARGGNGEVKRLYAELKEKCEHAFDE